MRKELEMIDVLKVAALLTGLVASPVERGMATYYSSQDFGGGPLYASPTLQYNPSNEVRWCAVNVSSFQDGSVLPGDLLLIYFTNNNQVLMLEAWDAGPFDGFYLEDFPNLQILVDIPQHLWPLSGRSAEIEMINLSAMERKK